MKLKNDVASSIGVVHNSSTPEHERAAEHPNGKWSGSDVGTVGHDIPLVE
jgi:hypothetical protein|tara:strand:- start:4630 stop:4779 length:150 start_codon:yes stop_codon:yes gene_type:complete